MPRKGGRVNPRGGKAEQAEKGSGLSRLAPRAERHRDPAGQMKCHCGAASRTARTSPSVRRSWRRRSGSETGRRTRSPARAAAARWCRWWTGRRIARFSGGLGGRQRPRSGSTGLQPPRAQISGAQGPGFTITGLLSAPGLRGRCGNGRCCTSEWKWGDEMRANPVRNRRRPVSWNPRAHRRHACRDDLRESGSTTPVMATLCRTE